MHKTTIKNHNNKKERKDEEMIKQLGSGLSWEVLIFLPLSAGQVRAGG